MGKGRRIKVKLKGMPLCTVLQTRILWLSDTCSPRARLANPLGCTQLRGPAPLRVPWRLAPGKGALLYTGAQSERQGTLLFMSFSCLPQTNVVYYRTS